MDSPVFCGSCSTLNPVDSSEDHFRLFGLPRRYAIDPDDLHRRFLSISRNIHPDFFQGQAPEMRNLALRLSSQVNAAYRTLKDPLLRAEYLLESSGGQSLADDKSVPENLLHDVMMLREEIEEAQTGGDVKALAAIREQIESRQITTQARVAALCERLDEQSDDVRAELRRQLNAMRYLANLTARL